MLLRLPRAVWSALRTIFGLLWRGIKPLLRFIGRGVLIKPYETILRLRRRLLKLLEEVSVLQLLRHYRTVLYLVAVSGLLVVMNSWSLQGVNAEDVGQNNLVFPLINQEIYTTEGDNSVQAGPVPTPVLTTANGSLIKPLLIQNQTGVAGRDRIEYYVVQSGDTLSVIANRFGLNLTTLLWENSLTARSSLRVGQRLTILPTDGISYKTKKGDTIAKIAKRFGASADDIIAFNPQGEAVAPGQIIIIPGGRPLAAPPVPVAQPPRIAQASPQPSYTPPALTSTRLQWPTPHHRITQYYSWHHTAIDIAENIGTPVYAAEAGVVEIAGWNRGGYGYYIIIDHGGGMETLYGHNSKLLVKAGDYVERGQQISESGSTGRSTGPHVHFEVRVNGRRMNPLNYVR